MRVLMIGRLETWMKFHLELMVRGFEEAGSVVRLVDYHRMNRLFGRIKMPEAMQRKQFSRQLRKIAESFRPDLIFFVAALKQDPLEIREYFKGRIVFYDYDGWKYLQSITPWLAHLDLLLTGESKVVEQVKEIQSRALYLPGAVDCGFFAPAELSPEEKRLYGAPISFVGRATPRRIDFCGAVADLGLAVYGERWHRQEACRNGGVLERSWRFDRDVSDAEAVKIYNASGCVINILRENSSMPSMQVYHVPACGACLLTEYCDDLPETFEIGKEILAFSSPEELREQAEMVLREPEKARRIGAAARKRCIGQYTFRHRAERILRALEG